MVVHNSNLEKFTFLVLKIVGVDQGMMKLSLVRLLRPAGHFIQKPGHSIMVSRLSWITGIDQLKEYFSKYGEVSFVHLPIDITQGIHKGYGFVHFANKNAVLDALDDDMRPKLDDVVIQVNRARELKPNWPHQSNAGHKTVAKTI
uniref:RRM domain-containing protein n=1 Tax=Panagrolaimus sp. JU765 TaxID=591449 RepID=A0AC34PVU2_9BILA